MTHFVLNDPRGEGAQPYVPLGQVDSLEDPRLVRIGYFEDGVTGRHDAAKILDPFIRSLLAPPRRPRVAVLLYGTASANKLAQTLLEFVRGGAHEAGAELTVYAARKDELTPDVIGRLPFAVHLLDDEAAAETALRRAVASRDVDYVGLFESSGMYRGDDLPGLLRQLREERLDAVWGSRRLSVRDIEASYRFHYFRNPWLRATSRAGSHVLSAAYLILYGRYVADTLSGVRIVRAADVEDVPVPLTHKLVNQYLLAALLRRRADVLEVPVRFVSLSPERVQRTGVGEGLRSLATIVGRRILPGRRRSGRA